MIVLLHNWKNMDVNEKTLNYLSNLAGLEIDPADHPELINDLNRILSFVDVLKDVDTEGLEPLTFINSESFLRDDIANTALSITDALKNAPLHNGSHFMVSKVIA
jgi:aspartyl-tRNA(Asn)/glutamyl-tRNA(Gln) amidotransferase subunit C